MASPSVGTHHFFLPEHEIMAFDTSDGFLRHTGPAGKAILSPKDDGTVKGGTSMGGKANSVRADSGFAGVLETAPPPRFGRTPFAGVLVTQNWSFASFPQGFLL